MCLHLAQDVVQRVGSRGALGDFARAVCARLAPQLMSTQHVEELLKLAQQEAPLGGICLGSALELLVDVAANSPSLFAELAPQVRRTLQGPLHWTASLSSRGICLHTKCVAMADVSANVICTLSVIIKF